MAAATRLVIQILGDEASAVRALRRTNREIEASRRTFARNFGEVARIARRAQLAIGAGIAAGVLTASKAIREFADGREVWSRLEAQLANVGLSFSLVEDRVRSLAREMQDVTRFGGDDTALALTTLLQITKDLDVSMRHVETAMNLAVARQMDLGRASQIVGRVIMGDTRMLRRYGIIIEDSSRALQELEDRFRGVARAQDPVSRGFARIRNEVTDVWGTLGSALVGGDDAADSLTRVAEAIKQIGEEIADNEEEIRRFAGYVERMATGAARLGIAAMRWIPFLLPAPNIPEAERPEDPAPPPTTLPTAPLGENLDERIARLREEIEASAGGLDAYVKRLARRQGELLTRPDDRLIFFRRIAESAEGPPNLHTAEGRVMHFLQTGEIPRLPGRPSVEDLLQAGVEERDRERRAFLPDNWRALTFDVEDGADDLSRASSVVVASFGAMVEAAIVGMDDMERVVIQGLGNVVQAALSHSNPFGGAIVGAVTGIVGALFARSDRDPLPVRVSEFSDRALSQQERRQGPDRLTLQIIDPRTGAQTDRIEYDLRRRTRVDAVPRFTSGGV